MIIAHPQKKILNRHGQPERVIYRSDRFISDIHFLYDRIAGAYSRDNPKFRDDLISRPLIVELTKLYGTGKRILDVGCGDGHISRLASPIAERVVGVDISPAMLNEALRRSGLHRNLSFVKANFLDLGPSFPNREFDLVLGVYAFCCMKNLSQLRWAFQSIYRVLKPGGSAIIQIPDENEQIADSNSQWVKDSPHQIHEIGKLVTRQLRAVDGSRVNVARYHYRQKDYLDCIKYAGFELQDVLEPKASTDLVDRYPSLKHEAEVSSSVIFILSK